MSAPGAQIEALASSSRSQLPNLRPSKTFSLTAYLNEKNNFCANDLFSRQAKAGSGSVRQTAGKQARARRLAAPRGVRGTCQMRKQDVTKMSHAVPSRFAGNM